MGTEECRAQGGEREARRAEAHRRTAAGGGGGGSRKYLLSMANVSADGGEYERRLAIGQKSLTNTFVF